MEASNGKRQIFEVKRTQQAAPRPRRHPGAVDCAALALQRAVAAPGQGGARSWAGLEKVVALSLGLVALGLAAVGLYLMRDRIPGPWRKPGAPTEGGDQAAEAAADAEPKSDDGPTTPEIAVV